MKPEIVLGPPGTGKTTALLEVLDQELAAGTPPDRIGFFSFTRRAAEEAVTRACGKFGVERSNFPFFRTLHSLCFRQLGMRSGDVLEGAKLQEFADHAGVRITGRWSEDGTMTGFDAGDRIMFMENLSRVRGIPLRKQYDEVGGDGLQWSQVDRVARALREFKAAKGLMDYTDMLSEFVRCDIRVSLDVLLLDETQDQSSLQWQVAYKLAVGARRVVVAGDDDQAIYRWAGADVDRLIDLEGDARVLGQSWRVPPVLQKLAGGIVERIRHRRPKEWRARDGVGVLDRASDFGTADVSGRDVLVLARNAYLLREQVEPELRRRGVIYERHGHPSVRPGTLEAVRTWERLRGGGTATLEECRRVYDCLSSGTGVRRGFKRLEAFDESETIEMGHLRSAGGLLAEGPWFEVMDRVPRDERTYVRAALAAGERLGARPRVRLSTIHGAKGAEADHVILFREMARRTYREMDENPEDEARVWYVAATRARERLTVVEAGTPQRCPWI